MVDYYNYVSITINVILAVIVVYKTLIKKDEKEKFLKRAQGVLEFMEKQHKLGNISKLIETTMEVVANKQLSSKQVDDIVGFIRQVGAL